MGKWIGLLLALLVAVGAFYLLGGGEFLGLGGAAGHGGGGGSSEEAIEGSGEPADGPEGRVAVKRSPVLFGRPRAELVGKGALAGKVMDWRTGKPVAEASVLVAGTGYGSEAVAMSERTDPEGKFRIADVPAGDAYSLRVDAKGAASRSLPSVVVPRGDVLDLGTIWLGQRGVLEGKVLDEEGAGVAGAAVLVHRGAVSLMESVLQGNFIEMLGRLDQEETPLAAGKTEGGGAFKIPDLDPGPITVVVRAAGFHQEFVQAAMTAEGSAGGLLKITLARGEILAGIVVDAEGRGIGGARIAVFSSEAFDEAFLARTFTDADRDGRFRLETLPAADKLVLVAAAAGFPTSFKEAKAGAEDVRVVMLKGATLEIRILEDGTDAPIEGAQLIVAVADSADLSGQAPGSMIPGTTDRVGLAEVATRPGQIQMLFVTHPEHLMGMWNPSMRGMGTPAMMKGPEDGTIREGRNEMTFRLARGVPIVGKVTGSDKRPIAGARVSAMGTMGIGSRAVTGPDGAYRVFGSSAEGQNVVMASAPGFVQDRESLSVKEKPNARGEIEHDVTLRRGAVVTGRVLGPLGTPLAGVTVKVKSGGAAAGGMGMLLPPRQETTAADGRYALDGIDAGDGARVVARAEDFVDGYSEPFKIEEGAVAKAPDVKLSEGVTIDVHVAEPDGSPAGAARVEVKVDRPAGEEWDFMSNYRPFADLTVRADGSAHVKHVPAGKVHLTASKKGFAPARTSVDVTAEGASKDPVRLELVVAVIVSGRVLDADGGVVKEARVSAVGAHPGGEVNALAMRGGEKVDAKGQFRFDDLPQKPASLRVTAKGYKTKNVPVGDMLEGVEIRLEKQDATSVRRREEIQAEIQKVAMSIGQAKDDAERSALTSRLMELQEEMQGLEGDGR